MTDYLEISLKSPKKGQHLYYYGVAYVGKNNKIVPFCTRKSDKIPERVVILRQIYEYSDKIQELAKETIEEVIPNQHILSQDVIDIILDKVVKTAEPVNLDPDELRPGSVVTHEDSGGHHFAIILEIEGNRTELLFLSSKRFGRRCREATKDELALTGFVYSKKTYLCLVTRYASDLCSQRLNLPEHRTQDLIREFILDN